MKLKRLLSIFTVIALVCSIACISAFAANDSPSSFNNYVIIGDSVPAGYGLYLDEEGNIKNPKGLMVDGSYPQTIANYLGAENVTNLSRDGFSTTQALRMLDPEFEAEFTSDTKSYAYWTDWMFTNWLAQTSTEEMAQLQEDGPEAIKNADVVTIELGNNDTFSYALCKSITDYVYTKYTGQEAPASKIDTSFITDLEAKFAENDDQLSQAMVTLLSSADFVTNLLVNMAEGYENFIPRYDRLISKIREYNPDCQIYVTGMYNPIKEVVFSDELPINVGRTFDIVVEFINLYMNTLSPNRAEYTYVDIPDTQTYEFPTLMSGKLFTWQSIVLQIHPTAEGHQYIANQIISAIEKNNSTVTENIYAGLQDINVRQCYFDSINYVIQHNIMTGTAGQAFEPDQLVTTAMVAQSLYALTGKPEVTSEAEYPDAVDGMWYTDAIKWAAENGIIEVYEDGTLRPMNGVTFGDISEMIKSFASYKFNGKTVNEGSEFNGIESGFTADTCVNRGQLAQILTNICK